MQNYIRVCISSQMGRFTVLSLCALAAISAFGGEWPAARRFDAAHLLRVALPMGGIGCGSVSLSGRGELVDWEIMKRVGDPAKRAWKGGVGGTP